MTFVPILGIIPGVGPVELMIIGVVAVLLFGSKLPSVARSLGKSMSEFKKGMQDIQNEFHQAGDSRPAQVRRYHDIDDREEATAPKFEPPASEPTLEEPRNETRETVPPDAADKPFDAAP